MDRGNFRLVRSLQNRFVDRVLGLAGALRSGSPKTVGESPSGARLLSVRLLPEEVRLRGKGAAQQLLVVGTYADGLERDLTAKSRFSIADPALAEIDDQGRMYGRDPTAGRC